MRVRGRRRGGMRERMKESVCACVCERERGVVPEKGRLRMCFFVKVITGDSSINIMKF